MRCHNLIPLVVQFFGLSAFDARNLKSGSYRLIGQEVGREEREVDFVSSVPLFLFKVWRYNCLIVHASLTGRTFCAVKYKSKMLRVHWSCWPWYIDTFLNATDCSERVSENFEIYFGYCLYNKNVIFVLM